MGLRFGRIRLVAALAVAAGALAVAPATGAPCEPIVALPDLWTRIAAPAFGGGGQTMTSYDSADTDVDHLVATNGTRTASTRDGGCTWTVADLPDDALVPDLAAGEAQVVGRGIRQVRYAAGSSTQVWAIGQTDLVARGLATAQPRVLYSDDNAATFTSRAEGLPRFGRPVAVRSAGGVTLVLFHETVPTEQYAVYLTRDAGGSWTTAWNNLPAFSDFGIDPVSGTVWLWSTAGLWRATPAAPPAQVTDVSGPVSTVDFGLGTMTVYVQGAAEKYTSTDFGRTFRRLGGPDDVRSASTHLHVPGLAVTSSTTQNVLVQPPASIGGDPIDYAPRAGTVSSVQFVHTVDRQGFPLYAFSPTALYRRMIPVTFALPPPPPPEPPIDVEIRDRKPVLRDPFIEPRGRVVELRPGQKRTVPYRVGLPPVPTPLDLFFMTDSTGSMDDTIARVQEGAQAIIDGLVETGIDLNVGVADFRDHPNTPQDSDSEDATYPYKRRRAVGPIDTELEDALASITTGGGSTDGHDSGLEAIYQAVTGAGRRDPLDGEVLIPNGLGANFRHDAMKVIVVATDDNFRHPGPANPRYPGPSLETVRATLKAAGVFLVGIVVDTNSGTARPDMETLATDTGAVAPKGGIDCDDDTQVDLLEDDPLVCDFDPEGGDSIAAAIVAMLSGIRDEVAVDLAVTGPRGLVRPAGRTHYAKVNVREENRFTLPVEFACTPALAGTEAVVRIAANARGEQQIGTTATVRCLAPQPPDPPVIPPIVVAGVLPPPPPPPAPVTNVQPNPNPNVNPNPNPQVNGNSGFAAQEDQEFQLAVADNEMTQEDLAMTGLEHAAPTVPALAWAAAFAMTGAAAFGLHLRRRVAPAPAWQVRR